MENTTVSNSLQNGKPREESNYSNEAASLKDIALACLSKWYIFVLSVFVALAAAVIYIASTAPMYNSHAVLLIKQDRRTGTTGADMASANFSNMGKLFTQNTNVFNEMIAFESPSLMVDVAKRLDLRADYTVKNHMYRRTLYGGSLPVRISMPDFPAGSAMGLTIRYKNRDSVEICKMYNYISGEKVEYKESIAVCLQDTVDTPVGKLVAIPSMAFYDTEKAFPDIALNYSTLAAAAAKASSGFSVDLTEKEATAITLSKTDKSFERARDILSALIQVYNEKWVSDQNQISVSTSEFINDRLVVIERELGDVDSNISQYKSSNKLLDPLMTGSMYVSQASQLEADKTETTNRLGIAEYIRQYLVSSTSSNQLLPANSGIENASIETQISEYNIKQLKRNNLVANSSVDNPVVISLDSELYSLRENIVASIDNYIVILKTRITSLERVESANAAKISMSPLQVEHLTDIERQQKVKESLYLYLLQKREENELSQAFTAYNTRILTPPSGSSSPVSPQRSKIILIAFLLGLAVPAVWIYFSESSNYTVRGRKDLDGMNVPFVGEIPLAVDYKGLLHKRIEYTHSNMDVVKPHSRDIINEAFRVARANIEFICTEPGCQVFMATSFNVGSGKSFCSLNIALSLAIKGKKVCLMDMDLRKKTISRFVKAPKRGISDFLASNVTDLDTIVMKDVLYSNLDVIPSGMIPPNPTELLYSDKMKTLMEYVRPRYDYVFIDCPPVEIVADASIISDYADHTLFVVRSGLLDRNMLPVIDKLYEQKRYNGMVILLNGTDINSLGSYSRHGYNYGYRYGYRYGYSYRLRKKGHAYGAYATAYGNGDDNKENKKTEKA